MNPLHKLVGMRPPGPGLVESIEGIMIDALNYPPGTYEAWWALRTKALQEFRRWV